MLMLMLMLLMLSLAWLPPVAEGSRVLPGLVGIGGRGASLVRELRQREEMQFPQPSAPPQFSSQLRESQPSLSSSGLTAMRDNIEDVAAASAWKELRHASDKFKMPQYHQKAGLPQPWQDRLAMQIGGRELAVASNAKETAAVSAKEALVSQHEMVSLDAGVKAQKTWEKVAGKSTEARAQLLMVRMWASRARMYANHAGKIAAASRHIVDEAAKKALEATKGWITSDAIHTAEATGAALSTKLAKSQTDKVAAAVAAAAEPCHLTLLRVQKFCAQTYSMAKSTQTTMQGLMTKAQEVAHTAQELQLSGDGLDAQTTMALAHNLMDNAEALRQHGLILYKQANDACSGAGYYTMCEQQAAANAAGTLIANAPMSLPAPQAL